MHFIQVIAVEDLLSIGRPTSTNNTNRTLFTFRPNDQDEPAPNRTDRNESILSDRMFVVKNLQVLDAGMEEFTCFLEADSMLPLVRQILRMIPCDLHRPECTPLGH